MSRKYSIIGGGTLIGMGIGFFLRDMHPMAFTACMFIGMGIGLVASTFLKNKD
ncbi:hypothetical protein [Jiulongibacter sediminis]|jgi:flagellar biosynthesis protein FliR|uniref:hypothetical protein n=1 Tax=Jiulongibacter sediminis TaxID=1605367 RepID=UPI0026F1D532|nr:hypothetical protein [Jiulongibacter sediminis]